MYVKFKYVKMHRMHENIYTVKNKVLIVTFNKQNSA